MGSFGQERLMLLECRNSWEVLLEPTHRSTSAHAFDHCKLAMMASPSRKKKKSISAFFSINHAHSTNHTIVLHYQTNAKFCSDEALRTPKPAPAGKNDIYCFCLFLDFFFFS